MATVIEVTGLRETLWAMQAFDPEAKKALRKVIREALTITYRGAKSEYGEGSWRVSVFSRNQKTGISVGSITAQGGTRRNPWNTSDPGVRASIFEFAGTKSRSDRPQVANMVKSLEDRYGGTGRFLWDAWDNKGGSSKLNDITREIKAAETRLQSMMDSAG